jgi:hypothetical protein
MDRILICSVCKKEVKIPQNQIGGFWWLNGFKTEDGKKHYGGYCTECFDKIREDNNINHE